LGGGGIQVADCKAFGTPLSDEQLDDMGGGTDSGNDCGVPESQFPCIEKCCSKSISMSGTVYKKNCPYCSIWSSFPDSTSLEVTYILDCILYGYGKRMKV